MGFQLAIYEGNQLTRRVAAVDQLMIGRGAECTLHFTDGSVSTRHARIVREGARLFVEDLGSHNRTVVEGAQSLGKGERAELRSGMALLLGRVRIVVEGEATSTQLEQTVQGEAELDVTLRPAPPPPPPAPRANPGPPETVVPKAEPRAPEGRAPEPPPETPARSSDSQTLVPEPPNEALAAQAFFQSMQPLLVLDSDACRKAVRIAVPRFTVGRSVGELAINHQMLSNPHAQIFYQAKVQRLFVEDKQSKNGTSVNGEALIANRPRELGPQTYLRFGTIDALLVMAKTYDAESLDDRRRLAFQLLRKAGKLAKERLKSGEEEAKKQGLPLEAALVVSGALKVTDWVQALEQARLRLLMPDGTRTLKLVIAVLIVAVIAFAALYFLKA